MRSISTPRSCIIASTCFRLSKYATCQRTHMCITSSGYSSRSPFEALRELRHRAYGISRQKLGRPEPVVQLKCQGNTGRSPLQRPDLIISSQSKALRRIKRSRSSQMVQAKFEKRSTVLFLDGVQSMNGMSLPWPYKKALNHGA